jgi:hypothetical protein
MDSNFIIIIGFVAIILVVFIFISSNSKKLENLDFKGADNNGLEFKDPTKPDESFGVILFVAFKEEPIGPIRITLEQDNKPEVLLSEKMDEELKIPIQSRTELKRRLYWAEGAKFLDESKTLVEQGVLPGNLLLLTDQEDPKAIKDLVDTLVNMESLQCYGDISAQV